MRKTELTDTIETLGLPDSSPDEKLPYYFTVIYTPKQVEVDSDMWAWNDKITVRSYGYQIVREHNKDRNGNPAVEIEQVAIRQGINVVEPEKWLAILRDNAQEIEPFIESGVFKVFIPDPDTDFCRKNTTDFSDLRVVLTLINNSKKIDWLEECYRVESQGMRDRKNPAKHQELLSKLSERISKLKREEETARAKASTTGITAYT